jgi:hypothetical protein
MARVPRTIDALLVDERERTMLIEKLQEYRGAPIAVPVSDFRPVELPRPAIQRENNVVGTVNLRFEPRDVVPAWTDRFNKDAGGPHWPPGLPIPHLENGCIEIGRLAVADVRRYVRALRRHVAATNDAVMRMQPKARARRGDTRTVVHRFEVELEEAQRYLDREFGVPSADASARSASPHAA